MVFWTVIADFTPDFLIVAAAFPNTIRLKHAPRREQSAPSQTQWKQARLRDQCVAGGVPRLRPEAKGVVYALFNTFLGRLVALCGNRVCRCCGPGLDQH